MNEARANICRQQLAGLLAQTYGKLFVAEQLLSHKARSSPASAEAHAFALIAQARQSIGAWSHAAGNALGIDVPTLLAGGPINGEEAQATQAPGSAVTQTGGAQALSSST